MSPDPLDVFWPAAEVEAAALTIDEMASWPTGVFEALTKVGLLREGRTASRVTCDACGESHVQEVTPVRYRDGTVRFFIRCPEHGRVEVDRSDLLQWSVDFKSIVQFLAAELATEGDVQERVPRRVWQIGRAALAGRSRPVWMGRGLSWPNASTLSGFLPAGKSPVLLVLGGAPRAGVLSLPPDSVVSLGQVLTLSGGEFDLDKRAIEDQLSASRGEGKQKSPVKRASRAAAIDVLESDLPPGVGPLPITDLC
jgi:hypothetical protein